MVLAAVSMIRRNKNEVLDCDQKIKYNFPLILGEGILVGATFSKINPNLPDTLQ